MKCNCNRDVSVRIFTQVDTTQADNSDRNKIAYCPECGQKLVEIAFLDGNGRLRQKCRRCKKYIRIIALNSMNSALG